MQEKLSPSGKEIPSHSDNSKVLLDNLNIQNGLIKLAEELNNDMKDNAPLFLCVVNGAIVFTGQLLPLLNFPMTLDYVHVSRYKNNQAGDLEWKHYPSKNINGSHVVIIDDVLDSGITISAIRDWCLSQGALSVETVVLLEKEIDRNPEVIQHANYSVFKIGKEFVYGFGLDNDEYWRNTKDIHVFED
ncbi:MAG: hypoxanthine-guanine phosphoribosyltransferase [Pseudomonadota bacterium]|nr:hypoxanthine-guanine phosphoribosyltransferase [Pseudomonadota bacterium]